MNHEEQAGQNPAGEAPSTGDAVAETTAAEQASAESTSTEQNSAEQNDAAQASAGQAEAPSPAPAEVEPPVTSLLFQAPDPDQLQEAAKAKKAEQEARKLAEELDDGEVVAKRRRRRRRGESDLELVDEDEDPDTVTKVRTPRLTEGAVSNKVSSVKGSTRLEAKRQRRRDNRAGGRRRQVITEAEFLARRESVDRQMIVRQKDQRIQIGVLEDGVLAEHFVSETQQDSLIGNVYLGRVQNVLPSMEAAFVDIGRGRNAVLYAGEVNWDASGLDGQPRRIENALKSGDSVLVQVTKDPIGHKGARLTSQISLPGRFLVYVPGGSMTGISRKLPDTERARLKKILKDNLPDGAGVIVRTAAEGAAEQELAHDINRLRAQWEEIQSKSSGRKVQAPELLYQEPDLTIKTVRDVFNEDFSAMVVQGEEAWDNIEAYVTYMAPDLLDRLHRWDEDQDVFDHYRIDEGLAKALDRKVYLPSGGSLVIDRTEAMTVVDVNTGKFTGHGGNLEETVTKNNLEAAEEIVRQLRLRDIGGIIVIDFIDMVLEANRDLVLRRLVECLGRDRTKHQVAEVTSLGLVQMTRKRMGTGLLEVFSEECTHCDGRGVIVQDQPIKGRSGGHGSEHPQRQERRRGKRNGQQGPERDRSGSEDRQRAEAARSAFATIAAATTGRSEQEDGEAPQNDPQNDPQNGPQDQSAQDNGQQEGQESRSAKKRKRRKRAKNRQEQDGQDQASRQEHGDDRGESAQGGVSGEPDLVLNIKGEVVALPKKEQDRRNQEDDSEENPATGEQGSFTLESLDEAFSSRRSTQRGSRRSFSPARTGQEGAEAARKAALEALEDLRPGRRRGSRNASKDENRGDQRNGDQRGEQRAAEERGESRGDGQRGSGRRDGDQRNSEKRGQRRSGGRARSYAGPIDPEEQLETLPSGVAQPGASSRGESAESAAQSAEQEPSVTETVAAAVPAEDLPPVPAKPARRRRGPRRAASSSGAGGEITSGLAGEAQGGAVAKASAQEAQAASGASAPEPEGIAMLGVGVKAEDIRRPM